MTVKTGSPTTRTHTRRPTTPGLRCDHSPMTTFPATGEPSGGSVGAPLAPLAAALAHPPDLRATASDHRNAVLSP